MKAQYVVGVVLAVAIVGGAGAYFYLQQHRPAPRAPVAAHAPAAQPPAPPAAAVPAAPAPAAPAPAVAPADCLLPGPPPVPPNGYTATEADMKLSHDSIQGFVQQLEAYQACRDSQADHAPADTPKDLKQSWIEQGDEAVDEAHALADAYSAQAKIFKSRQK